MGFDRVDTENIVDDAVNMDKIDSAILDAANGIPQLDGAGNLVGPVLVRSDTQTNLDGITLGDGEVAQASDTMQMRTGDGTTEGGWAFGCDDATIVALRGATNVISGTNLLAAYTAAKALTPGGSALSNTNRATLLVPAGTYNLGTGNYTLTIDGEFVDIIGVGTCRTKADGTVVHPKTIITGLSTTVGSTYVAPVKVTARNFNIFGISFQNTVSGEAVSHLACACVMSDSTNGNDQGYMSDCGFELASAVSPDGLVCEKDCGATFSQCHANTTLLLVAAGEFFHGTCYDCTGTGDSFGPTAGTTTGPSTLVRCKNLARTLALSFQGTMIDCQMECLVTGKSAVQIFIINVKIGAGDATDNGSGSTSTAVISGDVEDDFPVGSYVYNVADVTFHRVVSSTYSNPNTTVTVTPAASTTFASRSDIRASNASRFIGNTLITLDTDAIDTFGGWGATPAIVSNNRMNIDIDALVKNQIGTGYNVVEANLVSVNKDFS